MWRRQWTFETGGVGCSGGSLSGLGGSLTATDLSSSATCLGATGLGAGGSRLFLPAQVPVDLARFFFFFSDFISIVANHT